MHERSRPARPGAHRDILIVVAALVIVAPGVAPGAARAQCTTTSLGDNTPAFSLSAVSDFSFLQPSGRWMAVGVRSASGSEHRLDVYAQSAPAPACVQTLLGSSSRSGGVDVVVGDFRTGRNGAGTRYARVTRTAGSGASLVEREDSATVLIPGQPPASRRSVPAVFDIYQAFLESGSTYTLNLSDSGSGDLRVLVFRNPNAVGGLWAGRGAPEMLLDAGSLTLFTAPTGDDYAFVVVNDNGGTGTYSLWLEQCQGALDLVPGTPRATAYPNRYEFPPVDPYWTVLAVRPPAGADWNAAVYDTGLGAPEPVCFRAPLGTSERTSGVDFVVGDLFNAPLRSYYLRTERLGGVGEAQLHWDAGPDTLESDESPVARVDTLRAGEVARVWDVFLSPGSSYNIQFAPTGAAAARWFLFANPAQGAGGLYWAGRDAAIASSTSNALVTPTVAGWHGLVVVNENGQPGAFTLSVTRQPQVDAGSPAAGATVLAGVSPNPARGRTLVSFTLARPGRVTLEVHDVAGRVVGRLEAGERPAGPGALEWRSAAAGAPPGVYFLRLRVDGAVVGHSKLVLVD